jgi:hypothetical protein
MLKINSTPETQQPIKAYRLFKALSFSVFFTYSGISMANEQGIEIPTLDNARIFAEFKDRMPAVVNYFTKSSEQEVIEFYQGEFGEPTNKERKRDRLTLSYQVEKKSIRVVISEQNKVRQVDVIVESPEDE